MQKSFRRHDEENLLKLYEAYKKEPNILKNQDYINRSKAAADSLAEVLARDVGEPAAEPAPRD